MIGAARAQSRRFSSRRPARPDRVTSLVTRGEWTIVKTVVLIAIATGLIAHIVLNH